jgi:hypothetical protein
MLDVLQRLENLFPIADYYFLTAGADDGVNMIDRRTDDECLELFATRTDERRLTSAPADVGMYKHAELTARADRLDIHFASFLPS